MGGFELLASGEVKVRRGAVIEIVEDGLRMADGSFVPADMIVYATGYRPMNEWMGELISPEVERKGRALLGAGLRHCGDSMSRGRAAQHVEAHGAGMAVDPGRQYHAGPVPFAPPRLQLKARMEGVPTPVYRARDPARISP